MKRIIFSLFASLMLLTSCEHKDLCIIGADTARVRVEYDWRDAPDASPEGMTVYFYPVDGTNSFTHRRFDFVGTQGGEVEIPLGRYRLITYNNDTEAVQFSDYTDFDRHYAFTREGNILEPLFGNGMGIAPRSEGAEGEKVVITPDRIVGCHATDVEVTAHGLSYIHIPYSQRHHYNLDSLTFNADQVITLYPHDMLCHYTYEIRHVKNLSHMSRMSATLTGMAGGMLMGSEKVEDVPVTLPFPGHAEGDSTIVGSFYTFGHATPDTFNHRMALYVIMDDGAKYSYTTGDKWDVTDQVDNAPDPRNVHIIIDGLNLPTPIEGGEGFDPSVDDWKSVNEDIKI